MKTFKQTNTNLNELRAGDILELADGTRHEAIKDDRVSISCEDCSILLSDKPIFHRCPDTVIKCSEYKFHFEKQPK
jgi:hypothetical protein